MKTIAKKEYTSPVINIFKIAPHQVIASSFTPSNTTTTGTVTDDIYDDTFSAHADDVEWEDYE